MPSVCSSPCGSSAALQGVGVGFPGEEGVFGESWGPVPAAVLRGRLRWGGGGSSVPQRVVLRAILGMADTSEGTPGEGRPPQAWSVQRGARQPHTRGSKFGPHMPQQTARRPATHQHYLRLGRDSRRAFVGNILYLCLFRETDRRPSDLR